VTDNDTLGKFLLTEYLKLLAVSGEEDLKPLVTALYACVPTLHLPETLTATLRDAGKAGMSGNVFCDVTLAWLSAGANRALTCEEAVSGEPRRANRDTDEVMTVPVLKQWLGAIDGVWLTDVDQAQATNAFYASFSRHLSGAQMNMIRALGFEVKAVSGPEPHRYFLKWKPSPDEEC